MPILLVLVVTAACSRGPWVGWPPPLGLGPAGAALLTAAATLLPLAGAALLSGWVVRTLRRDPFRRPTVAARYGRVRRLLGWANLLAAVGSVLGLGWGWAVWNGPTVDVDGRAVLVPFFEMLVPAPYFAGLFLAWAIHYPAEKAFHRTALSLQKPGEFWSLPGFVLFHARQTLLLVCVPVGLFAAQQTLGRAAPRVLASEWFQFGSVAGAVALFVLMPRLVKPALGLLPLPPGPTRDRLAATARRLGVRYTDLLLWPTRGAMANALVVGVVPWARYVVFTDRLLDGLQDDEVDAVFGHEAGHVRHWHIPYYALFFVLSATAATLGVEVLLRQLRDARVELPPEWAEWLAAVPALGLAAYVFVVFGLLSRRCERQADVFGCRAGAGGTVTPAGVGAMVRALDRVAQLNGMDGLTRSAGRRGLGGRLWALVKAWQHGPVTDRLDFLLALADDPSLGDRVDRRVRAFRWALFGLLAAAVGLLGHAIGWEELLLIL